MSQFTLIIKPETYEIEQKYTEALTSRSYSDDSGLDVFFTRDFCLSSGETCLLPLNIRTEMVDSEGNNVSYILMPRSSIYKTKFRQSNSQGLIDAGYRGVLMVPIDVLISENNFNSSSCGFIPQNYKIEKWQRLFQICAPNLSPFSVKVLKADDDTEKLSDSIRGEKGFGSTGK
jgi:dUTP pyrophosphatase